MSERIIFNAFEKDGVVYPPLYEECENCIYCEGRLVGFNSQGEVVEYYCTEIDEFITELVEQGHWCKHYIFNSANRQEHENRLNELEAAGVRLGPECDPEHAKQVEDFLELD